MISINEKRLLEVIQSLKEVGAKTSRPMAVGVFTNEGGVRYSST